MWNTIARIIIRYRLILLTVIAVLTAYMAYMSKGLEPSYKFSSPIPEADSAAIDFQQFESHFETNSNAIVLGIKNKKLFEYANFKRWIHLMEQLENQDGVTGVISLHNLPKLTYDKSEDQFDFEPIGEGETIQNQAELDVYLKHLQQHPFYDGLLFDLTTGLSLTAINVKTEVLENKSREALTLHIDKLINTFEQTSGIDVHITGMPYIRTINSIKVKEEIGFFIGLALLVTALIMFLFFRSLTATFFSILVVGIGVIWSMGTMGVLGYNITILTAMIPPLIIVIGIPNCVFLLNKYHYEYERHGQKILSLNRVIEKVGKASLMTNLTTAAGFGTFILTGSQILVEFGIVAFINIIMVFVLSLIIIPSVYTGLKPPKAKHLRHLKRRWMNSIIAWMVRIVQFRKTSIYITFGAVLAISLYGISKIKTSGTLTDDIPKDAQLYLDMHFVEQEMKGVLPFEILIDTKKPQGVLKLSNLKRMEKLQKKLELAGVKLRFGANLSSMAPLQ
ncbi:MAG: efflux RND transporter permease subunit, partial [Flavobacteriales bacterium]